MVTLGDGVQGHIPVANLINPSGSIVAVSYQFGGGAASNVRRRRAAHPDDRHPRYRHGRAQHAVRGLWRQRRRDPAERDEPRAGGAEEPEPRGDRARTTRRWPSRLDRSPAPRRCRSRIPIFPECRCPASSASSSFPNVVSPAPMPSPGLLRTVCAYLDQRRLIATELYVIAPTYVPVSITLQVLAQPDADTATVEQAVESALTTFLDPLAGGSLDPSTPGTGWPFGGTIYFVDVLRVAAQVANVIRVADLVITLNGVQTRRLHGRGDSCRRAAHRAIRPGVGHHRSRRHGVSRMTNTAPFRNPPPGPPDDPTWMILRRARRLADGERLDRSRRVAARLRARPQEPARRAFGARRSVRPLRRSRPAAQCRAGARRHRLAPRS